MARRFANWMADTIIGGAEPTGIVENNVVGAELAAGSGSGSGETPAQNATVDYSKLLGEGGALNEGWRNILPEEIRGEKSLDPIKTLGTLAQSYVNAQRMIGRGKVAIPGDNATQGELDAFYKALGRPEKSDGYDVKDVKLPEGITLDESQMASAKEFAFKNGLSAKQFTAAVQFDAERTAAAAAAKQAEADAEFARTKATLEQRYGNQLPDVIAQCNKTLKTYGLTEVFEKSGLLNNLDIIEALHRIGTSMSESRLRGEDGVPSAGDPSSRLNDIRGNLDDPYYNREHPLHAQRVAEVTDLLARIKK